MMASKHRVCYLCGEMYRYCPNCSEYAGKPAFLSTFHNGNCKLIFQTCTDFNMNLITKEQAVEILSHCDLSKKENFKDDVRRTINRILWKKPVQKKHEVVE